jgi:hypothetical protein
METLVQRLSRELVLRTSDIKQIDAGIVTESVGPRGLLEPDDMKVVRAKHATKAADLRRRLKEARAETASRRLHY